MPDLHSLLTHVRDGGTVGEHAMAIILQKYNAPIRTLARRLVGPQLQSRVDIEDVIQSTTITLWLGLRAGKFEVTTSAEFIALVKVLLQRHVAQQWRRKQL